MSGHTPGPWTAEPSHHERGYNVVGPSPQRKLVSGCCIQGGILTEDNARLIAAAPEMLDVLRTIENDGQQVPAWLWERIQAVIAKATPPPRSLTSAAPSSPSTAGGGRP